MPFGVNVTSRSEAPTKAVPTSLSTLFVPVEITGVVPFGEATELRRLSDFVTAYGARNNGNRAAYDYVETAFREGVPRIVLANHGDATVGAATVTIATPGVVSLAGHGLTEGDKVKLTTTGALPTGLTASTTYYVVDPAANTFNLSATNGGAAINTTGSQSGTHTLFRVGDLADATDTFIANLGPGLMAAPQETPGEATYDALAAACEGMNRVPLLDVAADSFEPGNESALTALSTLIDASEQAIFGPWVTVPAPSGTVGVGERSVPASAAVAGLICRALAASPNRAAAGRDFPLQYATGFASTVDPADIDTLANAGVNVFADVYGVMELCSFQTGIEPTEDTPFWQFNCVLMKTQAQADALAVGLRYRLKTIDGQGKLLMSLKTDLDAIWSSYYQANALFGATKDEAYQTTVSVSLIDTANGELNATAELRLSLHAKTVNIDLVSVPILGAI